ncbi:nuclear transport factor 2 family protein [Mycobacterium sp. NPDC050041]|uniref:nuclear transport factor 2 family protein n=1 Tax=Mycobacterium sp. NPDC050041 TaxID=3364293 RepID=UPI003C2EE972
MSSAEHITEIVNLYLELVAKGNADAVAELYADDATVEDPVGGEVHIGRQAIRGFYGAVEGVKAEAELLTLRVAGHEAAFHFRLTLDFGETQMQVDPIDVMVFNDEGKIQAMKAYWTQEHMKQL